ncbi:uncharacterized protein LOC111372623 [Olea europaea var. sylvestris]|uniref:uncharacterized protein LOC111372623 n=1 Tax=Olea europaea var. sylvestris TaxID=158386 RepID=UPI000C1CE47D|nr:uncharacterized protein LOC111372623 [Olea europaea var. sylvestris]
MANKNPNQIAGANLGVAQPNIAAVNENTRLMGEYMVPLVVESQSSIVYPAFGQAHFHLRTDVINMFQNVLQFFGKATENPNTHITRFLDMYVTTEYSGVSSETIRLRLFPYTLRDSTKEWANVDSVCDGSITKRTADQVYQIIEDLAFTSALWSTERTSGKKAAGKVDQMSVAQTVGPKCKHCGRNHKSVDCNVGSPFAQTIEDVNYTQNFQRQQHNPNPNTYYPGWRNHPGFQ